MEKHEKKETDHSKEADFPAHHHTHHHAHPQHQTEKVSKPLTKSFYLKLYIVLTTALVIVAVFNIVQGFSLEALLNQKLVEAKEAAIPANIQLVTITNSECRDCFDIAPVIASLKNSNVNITEERSYEFDSQVAEELIRRHGIEKIPAILVSGEISKLNIRDLEQKEGILIFNKLSPPYTKAETGEIVGKVSTIFLVDSSCKQCDGLNQISTVLRQSGVVIKEQKTLESSTPSAQELIKRLSIKKLPAFLISNDIDVYAFVEKIRQSGITEKRGYYVLESPAPYVEVETGKVRGLVDLKMITSKACSECYDVRLHQQIFSQMGITFANEETIDLNSAEGIKLRMKYKLKKVPTIILTGDIDAYEKFNQAWQQVGTIESDGAYVFRNVELLGQGIIYKNLETGETVGAASSTTIT